MDVHDLRSELARRAGQMPAELGTAARLAAVRRRVRARRQRLAGSVVGVAVLGVGVVALLPSVVDRDAGHVVEPATPTQTPSGETPGQRAPGLGSWPSRIDGNTFLAGRSNESDRSAVTWTMTVPKLDVLVSMFCQPDGKGFPDPVRVMSSFAINGHQVYGSSCTSKGTLQSSYLFTDITNEMMRDFGVRPGRPFTVEMSLEHDRAPVPVTKALLGLALYAPDGEVRQITPGWSIPALQGVPGDEQRLVKTYKVPVPRSRTLGPVLTDPDTPRGSTLSYGWARPGDRGTFELSVDGQTVGRSSAGGISYVAVTGDQRLMLEARGGGTDGTLFIGVYEPVDGPE